jgi:hypothetical protein
MISSLINRKILWSRRGFSIQVLLTFVLILALKWNTLNLPPFWDTAMGLFPAAITLDQYDFNLLKLLRQPGYLAGGPNVHATSLVTILTALIVRLTGDSGLLLPVLHLLHFLVAAITLVSVYQLALPVFNRNVSLLCTLSLLTFPMFLTQTGFMYLEIPLLLCTVRAVLSYIRGQLLKTIIWTAVALLVKQPGLIVAGAILIATLLERRPIRDRIYRVIAIGILPVLTVSLLIVLRGFTAPDAGTTTRSLLACMFDDATRRLFRVPDLVLLMLASVAILGSNVSALYASIRTPIDHKETIDESTLMNRVLGIGALVMITFYGFHYVALPLLFDYCIHLPRYYIQILPFLFISLGFGACRVLGSRKTILGFVFLTAFFIINREAIFYPREQGLSLGENDHPVTERSAAYRRLISIQIEAMRFLEKIPSNYPIYFGRYDHYVSQYPLMGYVTKRLVNGHNLGSEGTRKVKISAKCAYFLYTYPYLGGATLIRLLEMVKNNPAWVVERIRVFQDGPYKIRLFRVRKTRAECPV